MEAAPFLRNIQQAAADTETEWSFEEIKIFERAIIPEELGFDCDNPFERIAARLPRKTEAQVRIQWQMLVRDIEMIEAGSIPLPHYNTSTKPKRRRGVPWTKEENELFERGLKRFGKGDWKSISRHFVESKRPSQVASHAQKYFLRLEKSRAKQNLHSASTSNHFRSTSSSAPPSYQ
ncbi:transcription factor DIVARICATA-like [Corylus avellana]|uniref:transcription factor DIVARICATA-like n=1 Tax=Corylus avellana TaxID=13451 RepID=UPI00286AC05D|nr:transcription factor DIVARICATA-like [Corylus avellana]